MQLHALHPAAIPFENLDPLMGVPVRLELTNLQQKLLFDRRGGYCLEHNLLFKALLEDLDYKVKGVAARVLWGLPAGVEPLPSHLALTVDIGGSSYLADVGFGGKTLTTPMRLRAEIEQQTPHDTFRLMGGGEADWGLQVKLGDEWQLLYRFDLVEKNFEDTVDQRHASSARPSADNCWPAARAEKGRRLALRNVRASPPTRPAARSRRAARVGSRAARGAVADRSASTCRTTTGSTRRWRRSGEGRRA